METSIPKTIGRYQMKNLLGKGGMGNVYLAHDPKLSRDVAIKLMHPHFADQENFRERFLQEAKAAAGLKHPGIVVVHDSGDDNGLLYIVMDYIKGHNLAQMFKTYKEKKQWLPLSEAISIVRSLCSAIDYAHKHGIFHRDIKPQNIMIEPEPFEGLPFHPIITDLGLAKLSEGGLETKEGSSMGTPSYMSPEQAGGEPVDARSDVYSLGVLLYELCVGKLPFQIGSITEAVRIHIVRKETPPPPRSINDRLPPELETIILKALEKDPASRFQNALELVDSLNRLEKSDTVTQSAPTFIAPPDAEPISIWTQYQKDLLDDVASSVLDRFPATQDVISQDRIEIISRDRKVRIVHWQGNKLTIGQANDNDIVIEGSKVYHHHAQIEFDGKNFFITDLNSDNGTFLQGQRLLPGKGDLLAPKAIVRIGDHWLRVIRAKEEPSQPKPTESGKHVEPITPLGQGVIDINVENKRWKIDAGGSIVIPIRVSNNSPQVGHYRMSVSGIPDGWIPSPPGEIRVMPGEPSIVQLQVQVPRDSQSHAGIHTLSIAVSNANAPEQKSILAGELEIAPFGQFTSQMRPEKLRAGKSGEIILHNQGNDSETFDIKFSDRGEELHFKPAKTQVRLLAGEQTAIQFDAWPRQQRWIGGVQSHPMTLQVTTSRAVQQTIAGEVVGKGIIPLWLLPIILMLCALIALKSEDIISYLFPPTTEAPPVIDAWCVYPANKTPADLYNCPLQISVDQGQSVIIFWNVKNARSVQITPGGTQPSEGQLPPYVPMENTVITLSVNDGEIERSVEIIVIPATPTPDWNATNSAISETQAFETSNAETATANASATSDAASATQAASDTDGDCIKDGLDPSPLIPQITTCDISRIGVLKLLKGHVNRVNDVSFSPDGKYLASGSSDGTIRLWKMSECANLPEQCGELFIVLGPPPKIAGQVGESRVMTIDFSPDGSLLIAGYIRGFAGGSLGFWQLPDGVLVRMIDNYPNINELDISPDGKLLAIALDKNKLMLLTTTNCVTSRDECVKPWFELSGKQKPSYQDPDRVTHVTFSPDGSLLAATWHDDAARLWRVTDLYLLETFPNWYSLGFSHDGSLLAGGQYIEVWKVLDCNNPSMSSGCGKFQFSTNTGDMVCSIFFAPVDKLVAGTKGCWGSITALFFWNADNGNLLHSISMPRLEVTSIAFSPDGTTMVTGASDGSISVWQVK